MISCKQFRAVFSYDPVSGVLYRGGKAVGTKHTLGYLKVKHKGRTYLVHRIAFLIHYGKWPTQVDHVNGDKSDNRLVNLRECGYSGNNAHRGLMVSNTSGFKGVHFSKSSGLWRAQAGYTVIGYFRNKTDAAKAYDRSAIEQFGEYATTNKSLGLL